MIAVRGPYIAQVGLRCWLLAGVAALAAGCSSDASSGRADSGQTTVGEAATGVTFDDPQGTYTMRIDPSWVAQPGVVVKEVEDWTVGPTTNGFAPNVNVLTQDAPGLDLAGYMKFGREHMGALKLIDSKIVNGANGNELGLLEYSAPASMGKLHFLATMAVTNGQAVVATLSAEEDQFAALRDATEPYLLTLQPS
jgi:hypothetical protein